MAFLGLDGGYIQESNVLEYLRILRRTTGSITANSEMCKMLMVKLFSDKQIIIKNKEIFDFIFKRLSRTYLDIYIFVEKLDRLSLEKKRQLTIPLIKEII